MEEALETIFSGFQGRQDEIIPILWKIQETYRYLPDTALHQVARFTKVPENRIYGVASFYTQLKSTVLGIRHIMICRGTACWIKESKTYLEKLENYLGIKAGETSADGKWSLEVVECLGLCDYAPSALVNGVPISIDLDADPESWLESLEGVSLGSLGGEPRWLTKRCGVVDPKSLEDYKKYGGLVGLKRCLSLKPSEVIDEIVQSGLSGRGGAAFPTGLKWKFSAAESQTPRYVICNADESEPGTFKDRILMEGDPFSIIEGMLIAGYAIGSAKGYIYIRGEYHRPRRILQAAIEKAYQAGYLGENILGSSFSFDLEIRSGAGAYICGEETALFESIEGNRGIPRTKPPFPTTNGLFDRPTIINNVETLCMTTWIMTNGVQAYRAVGTETSPGTKLFCLSGDVRKPGVYEVPLGTRLDALIELAGGVQGELQAILLGGAAGAFIGPDQLDLSLSFESLAGAGLPLGSGVVMLINKEKEMSGILYSLALFFAHESCGKCFPCRLGTRYQQEIIENLIAGQANNMDIENLKEIGINMTNASYCGLGQTASVAIRSALDKWPGIFSENLEKEWN
ncbi:MAG: NAD(P)H-dependent oxidoreductase subunit E [Anaerolineales bacterium]